MLIRFVFLGGGNLELCARAFDEDSFTDKKVQQTEEVKSLSIYKDGVCLCSCLFECKTEPLFLLLHGHLCVDHMYFHDQIHLHGKSTVCNRILKG